MQCGGAGLMATHIVVEALTSPLPHALRLLSRTILELQQVRVAAVRRDLRHQPRLHHLRQLHALRRGIARDDTTRLSF